MPYDFERARDAQGQIRVMGVVSQVLRQAAPVCRLCCDWRAIAALRRGRLADFLDAFAGTMADRLIPIEPDAVAAL